MIIEICVFPFVCSRVESSGSVREKRTVPLEQTVADMDLSDIYDIETRSRNFYCSLAEITPLHA